MDVPVARRASRPAWVNTRTVLGVMLFCLAVLLGRQVLESRTSLDLVWAAASDLPEGAEISSDDLRAVEVLLTSDVLSRYVAADALMADAVLARPVAEGELISASWLITADAMSHGRVMSIPVAAEHAVGGELRPGDRVDIYATFDAGDLRARTRLLARAVEVIDVVTAGGFAIEEDAAVGLTIAVTTEDAALLTFAIRTGEVDVVKVIGPGEMGSIEDVTAESIP